MAAMTAPPNQPRISIKKVCRQPFMEAAVSVLQGVEQGGPKPGTGNPASGRGQDRRRVASPACSENPAAVRGWHPEPNHRAISPPDAAERQECPDNQAIPDRPERLPAWRPACRHRV